MYHRGCGLYQICINDEPGLTLTFYGKAKFYSNVHFSITVQAEILILVRYNKPLLDTGFK